MGLNEIVLMNSMTLVGCFGSRKYNSDSLNVWAALVWKNVISRPPVIFLLPREWIAFKFFSMEDAALVLAGIWKWENAGLLIKIWMPLFDPRIERYDQIPIWVKLPNLHGECT